jgi:hypothetical protein
MTRIYQLCFTASCILLLANCGAIDLAYNHAPGYVAGEFDEAFDLSNTQGSQLDSRLDQLFAWHRKEELLRYQQFLDEAAIAAADGITAAEFLKLNHEVRDAWQRSLSKAIDSLGDLAVTLSSEQIENYQSYHRAESEEYQDYLEMSTQQREIYRLQRGFDQLEKWFGNFDSIQEEKVMTRLQQLPDFYGPWIRYREARQQAFVNALGNTAEADLTRQNLKTILLDPATEYARTFEPARRSYWQAYAAALEDISALLTKKQRQKVVTKLQKYARIAARLNNQS